MLQPTRLVNLAHLEREASNLNLAINHYGLTKLTSPQPQAIQKQIDEIKSKLAGATNTPAGR